MGDPSGRRFTDGGIKFDGLSKKSQIILRELKDRLRELTKIKKELESLL